MQVFKSVWEHYTLTPEISWLLEQFHQTLNDCVRIGLAENVTGLKSLSLKAYRQLSRYDVASYYKLCAISAATGILRNYLNEIRPEGFMGIDRNLANITVATSDGTVLQHDLSEAARVKAVYREVRYTWDMSGAECSPYIRSGEASFLSWYVRDAYASVRT